MLFLTGIDLASVGAASAATIALLTAVFVFLKPILLRKVDASQVKNDTNVTFDCGRLESMAAQIDRLARQHDIVDDDGAPIWYFPRSHERAVNKMVESLERFRIEQGVQAEKQTALLEQLIQRIHEYSHSKR